MIDLRGTDKSRYFATTEFKNCFSLSLDHEVCCHILKSLSNSSHELMETVCHFSHRNVVTITHAQNIVCIKTPLHASTHDQTIISID